MEKYLEKARILTAASFNMYGLGNFDLTLDDIALILFYLDKENYHSLSKLYERLEKQRMG